LAHYLEKGAVKHVAPHADFDSRWYLATHLADGTWPLPALAHYLRVGAYQGLAPGPGVAGTDGRSAAAAAYRENVQRNFTRMVSSSGPADICDRDFEMPHELAPRGTKRVAVYTAILGDYDTLKLPYPEWANSADFFCFTDRRFGETGAWRLVSPDYHSVDPTRIARFYKTHPHVFLRHYDIVIWIDGNIGLRVDPVKLVGDLEPEFDILSFRHPLRRTIDEVKSASPGQGRAKVIRAGEAYRDAGYVRSRL
jgi:hypothetical protein